MPNISKPHKRYRLTRTIDQIFAAKAIYISGGRDAGIRGVHVLPGATALTRIPLLISDNANERVKEATAPFVAE